MATNWEQKQAAPPEYAQPAPAPIPQSPTPAPFQPGQQQYFQQQPGAPMQPVQMTGISPQQTGQPQVVYMQNGVPMTAQPMPQGQPMPMQMQPQPMGMPQQRTYQNATPLASLGRSPAPIDCPACGQRSMSRIEHIVGNTTHAWALGLCCLTGLFCFLPYIMDGFKDVDHHCGQCGVLLATWHKSGGVEVHQHQ